MMHLGELFEEDLTALSTGSVDNLPSLLLERFYYPILPVEAGMKTTEVQMETPGLHGEPGAVFAESRPRWTRGAKTASKPNCNPDKVCPVAVRLVNHDFADRAD